MVNMLTIHDIKFYQEVIGKKYLLYHNVWTATDGLISMMQEPDDDEKKLAL